MSNPVRSFGVGSKTLVVSAAFVVVTAGLKAAGTLVLPFLVAVFLSVLAAPMVLWLERRGMVAWAAVTLAMVAVVGVLLLFGMLLTTALIGFDDAIPVYRDAFEATASRTLRWLREHGMAVELGAAVNPSSMMGMASNLIGSLIAALSNTVLVALTMMFILLEIAGFPKKMRAALEDPHADLSGYDSMLHEVQRYLGIKTAVSVVTGASATLLLLLVGVDFPILWGLIAFLLNYIPTVGSIFAAIPAILLAAIQPGLGLLHALMVMLGYVVINTVFGNIVEPQLMGRRLGLSPLVVFMSLVFWGWVWGPVGMLLSVPLTMMVKIMLEQTNDLRWIAVFLGSQTEIEQDAGQSMVARIRLRRGVRPEDILRSGVLDRVTIERDPSASQSGAARIE